jgi:hypothetical protein
MKYLKTFEQYNPEIQNEGLFSNITKSIFPGPHDFKGMLVMSGNKLKWGEKYNEKAFSLKSIINFIMRETNNFGLEKVYDAFMQTFGKSNYKYKEVEGESEEMSKIYNMCHIMRDEDLPGKIYSTTSGTGAESGGKGGNLSENMKKFLEILK